VIAILGLVGGLFKPISFVSMLVVSFIVRPGFTEFMTKNLFLVSKYPGDEDRKEDEKEKADSKDDLEKNEAEKDEEANVRHREHYDLLKKRVEEKKTYDEQDVNNIVDEMFDKRQTISQLASESSYKWYFYFQYLNCGKKTNLFK